MRFSIFALLTIYQGPKLLNMFPRALPTPERKSGALQLTNTSQVNTPIIISLILFAFFK